MFLNKIKILFASFFLISCENEDRFNSLGEQLNPGFLPATSQGGTKGVKTLNAEIKKLKKKLKKAEEELEETKEELEETEEELEETEEKLEEIEDRLENDPLTPEQRQDLEEERDRLRNRRDALQTQVNNLNTEKTRLEGELAQKQTELTAVKAAKARLETDLATARQATTEAETERDCWKKTKINLCDRTEEIQTAILAKFSDISDCNNINYCHLETITDLDFSVGKSFDPAEDDCPDHKVDFKPTDFVGLTNLETLNLSGNCLSHFEGYTEEEGFFNGLDSIEEINLQETNIVMLSQYFFTGVLDTLNQVAVDDFIYCGDPEPPFKSKLYPSSAITPHNDPDYSSLPHMESYCY